MGYAGHSMEEEYLSRCVVDTVRRTVHIYSNEGDKWQSSEIRIENNLLKVNFVEKFNFRRGRINCSLNDKDGWRFFGIQFSKKLN